MSNLRNLLNNFAHYKLDKNNNITVASHTFRSNNKDCSMKLPTHESQVNILSSYINDVKHNGNYKHPSYQIYEHVDKELHKFYVDADIPPDITSPIQLVHLMKYVLDEFGSSEKTETCVVLQNNMNNCRYIWPKFLVRSTDAAIIVTRLAAVFAGRDKSSSYRWKDIFTHPEYYLSKAGDKLLYPYCMVHAKCTSCSSRRERECCMNCNGSGVVYEPDMTYRIKFKVTFSEGTSPEITEINELPNASLLIAVSIASEYYTTDLSMDISSESINISYPIGTPHCQHINKKIKATGSMWGATKKNRPLVEESFARYIQILIRTQYSEFHSECIVTPECIIVDSKRKLIKVAIKGKGSNTCTGKRKDHKDSYVYFIISPQGIRQECFSKEIVEHMPCCTRMKNKPFRQLPSDDIKKCFPTHFDAGSNSNLSVLNERENELNIVDMNISTILNKQQGNSRKTNVLDEHI